MKLSTQTRFFAEYFGLKNTVDILQDAGFDAADFSAGTEEFCTGVHDKAFYDEIKKYSLDKGFCFNQAHAPHPTSYVNEEESERAFENVVTSMKNASYLGVPVIVVHPCQHLDYYNPDNVERLFEYNMRFYRRLIPYCEEYGIKIATENMWQYPGMISHSTCSRPEEFIRYVDELSSEWIVACFDIGHSVLVREQPDEFIRMLGGDRLKCLHVHDVDGTEDLHTFPYFGITDWDAVMKALADINYGGDLTFEPCLFYENKPAELYPHYAKLQASIGNYLVSKFYDYLKK